MILGLDNIMLGRMRHPPCKTAELIELSFVMVSEVGPRKRVFGGRAYGHHLVNTVERLCAAALSGYVTRGGDAACSQTAVGNLVQKIFSD